MILDVTDATFEADVIRRSMATPVVVDLWAPWCGPCKTLGPILEKVIGETDGKVALAKINVDENPQASAAFHVQSIPAVYALDKGQVVGNFLGAQPEPEVRNFVNGLLGTTSEAEVAALVARGDEASLRRALDIDSTNRPAMLMLGQLLIGEGRNDEAVTVLSAAPPGDDQIGALLEQARQAVLPPDARFDIEAKLAALLPSVKADDDARAEFVGLLDELSSGDPAAAADWRRKLSAQLF